MSCEKFTFYFFIFFIFFFTRGNTRGKDNEEYRKKEWTFKKKIKIKEERQLYHAQFKKNLKKIKKKKKKKEVLVQHNFLKRGNQRSIAQGFIFLFFFIEQYLLFFESQLLCSKKLPE